MRIVGVDGLQIDGVVTAQLDSNWYVCCPMWTTNTEQFRIRLYLIDYPGDTAKVLTVAVVAPDANFESVLQHAAPIVKSLEIRPDWHPGTADTVQRVPA